ncbi:phosphatase PAP2 family protein [Streptococcus downei]|uniref:PAP2 family protein n=1 Tax=Streptococcus downei MFe28 TaxID=764290 RepID=A0A380JIH1_STRDO|nr:phosphatase PAP2 family protein [Streptococcus downei]EFQ58233.1 PAP2 family protein [Streptococcus downei F0415]SUN37145.1 PAP2 family protein [Streptococcus downei MFe28]
MHNRQKYFIRASFAALIFVILGYIVKFDPRTLQGFDRAVQSAIRGDLPAPLTTFFRTITHSSTLLVLFVVVAGFFIGRKWYIEAGLLAFMGVVDLVLVLTLKNLYQRPRPSIKHLVVETGYSFPSAHSLVLMLIVGSMIIIAHQRIKRKDARYLVEFLLGLAILLIGLSRIYLGVHYPTDVLASFVLGYGILNLVFPFYDELRFEWRFKHKQN